MQPFRMKVNGVWVDYEIDICVLRQSLGLPSYSLFHKRLLHGYNHPEVQGEDVEDIDHIGAEEEEEEEDEESIGKPYAEAPV